MPLKVVIGRSDPEPNSLYVTLHGSLDTATAPDLRSQLQPKLDDSVQVVVFDLAGLDFLSSAGLQVFVGVQKLMGDRKGKVLMIGMQPQIQKVFDIVKAMKGFSVFASVKEMDEYLAQIQAEHRAK